MGQLAPTAMKKVGLGVHELARQYALKAQALAPDPQGKAEMMKVSLSSVVWALYHVFTDEAAREVLNQELKAQSAAIERALAPNRKTVS